MKRGIATIIILILTAVFLCGCSASRGAEYYTDESFVYWLLEDGTLAIGKNYLNSDSIVILPNASDALEQTICSVYGRGFLKCDTIERLYVEDGYTVVGARAFAQCGKLTYVSLPSTLERIKAEAFKDCFELTTFIIYATQPPVVAIDIFANCEKLNIYVPALNVNAYKEADFWSGYAEMIAPLEQLAEIFGRGDSILSNTQ